MNADELADLVDKREITVPEAQTRALVIIAQELERLRRDFQKHWETTAWQ